MRITAALVGVIGVIAASSPAAADYVDMAKASEACGTAPSERGLPNCGGAINFDPDPELINVTPPIIEEPVVHKPPIDYEQQYRPVFELVWRAGGARVFGVQSDSVNAFGFDAGVHRDRFALLAEYSIGGVGYHTTIVPERGDGTPVNVGSDGLIHRFGALARYSFAKIASTPESDEFQVMGDLFIDAGAGVEVIRWDDGGTLVRPDLALGIGGSLAFRVSNHQRGALSVALRSYAARRSDRDGLAELCSAPCSWPSSPTSWSDRSYMLEVGYTFGP
jgi:hypothetical protein